jgi:hypothetical protein
MWIVYEITLAKGARITPGIEVSEAAFVDPEVFRNSGLRASKLIVKVLDSLPPQAEFL